jgi:two-component system sensor histidine kinase/response regulator
MEKEVLRRILIVDDNPGIHEDFKKILVQTKRRNNIKEILFGKDQADSSIFPDFQIDSAFQGPEALEFVKKSRAVHRPYSLAFVDVRMPPGWNGINTIKYLWEIDPNLQIVICTAYSDYSWAEMFAELKGSENFLVLKKPFDAVEVRQMAVSLTRKWEYKHRIEHKIDNLAAAVREKTEDLRHALELAEDANKLKNAFLGNMSHELRTPLNAIVGFAQLMKEIQPEYCEDILSNAKFLLQMISDIVDMSLLESNSVNFTVEEINIQQLINDTRDIFNPLLKARNIEFSYFIDPSLAHIKNDLIKLKQLFRYYLSNAIKFSEKNSKIELRVLHVDKDHFKIEVMDHGIGIREEDIKKLFIPFQQLDMEMSKKYQGIGLGLALARRIVEFQGGTVGVNSNIGKGSTFFAVLPYQFTKNN